MTNARFDDKNLSVRFTKIKLDIYKPTINLVQSSADQGGSKITIPIPQKYIYYTYNVMLPLIDLEPISSPLIIILLFWLTLFAFHKYINYSSPPKAFLDYIFNCAYLLSIYQLNNNNNSAGNDNNNKCTVQNKTAQIICDDINVNTIYTFTSTRECGITLDEIWKVSKRRRFQDDFSYYTFEDQIIKHGALLKKSRSGSINALSSPKLIEEDFIQEEDLALLYNIRNELIALPNELTINQNFHLFYSVKTNAISAVLLPDRFSGYEYDLSFTSFVNAPTEMNNILRRDIIFLLDTSASTTGKPCIDAVRGLMFTAIANYILSTSAK